MCKKEMAMTIDNSPGRLHDVLFYGLYMDPEILRSKNVNPRNPRHAVIRDHELRVGKLATLLRAPGKLAHGIVYSLTHEEIFNLYEGAGLTDYRTEALLVDIGDTESIEKIPALCCNLLSPPHDDESNDEYVAKLKSAMLRLKVPVIF